MTDRPKKYVVSYLTKRGFVDKMCEITAGVFTKLENRIAYDAFMAVLISEIEQGQPVNLPQFGKFYFAARKEKLYTDPSTGEQKIIPPRLGIRLKVSPTMRKDLNKAPVPEHLLIKKDLTSNPDCSIEVATDEVELIQVDTTQSIK
jgi:nucleoid DNA-binding protein